MNENSIQLMFSLLRIALFQSKPEFEMEIDTGDNCPELEPFLLPRLYDDLGKTVFLTREEAEKALERRENGK